MRSISELILTQSFRQFILSALILIAGISVFGYGALHSLTKAQSNEYSRVITNYLDDYERTGDTFQLTRNVRALLRSTNLSNVVIKKSDGSTLIRDVKMKEVALINLDYCQPYLSNDSSIPSNENSICVKVSSDPRYSISLGATAIFCILILIFAIYRLSATAAAIVAQPLTSLTKLLLDPSMSNERTLLPDGDVLEIKLLLDSLDKFTETQKSLERVKANAEKNQLIREITQQVAHDISSPLSALASIENSMEKLDTEERELFSSCLSRVRSIVKDLQSKTHMGGAGVTDQLPQVVKKVCIEKNAIFGEGTNEIMMVKFHEVSELPHNRNFPFANIAPAELSRIISNLIQNAFEASNNCPDIDVTVMSGNSSWTVLVEDRGTGIDLDFLPHVGTRGFTSKPNGNGFGVHHCRKALEESGGRLHISSRDGGGTCVEVKIPMISS